MKISGAARLAADPAVVFNAFQSPEVLVRTLPGCQRLEVTGPDAYKMTVAAGVGSVKGVYDGQVQLTDKQEPWSFRMLAQGAGAPGTIGADVVVTLTEHDEGGTALIYEADAIVGGMIGGVGQRMLTGVSKKMAAEFFANVDKLLAEGTVAAGRTGGAAATVDGTGPLSEPASEGWLGAAASPGSAAGPGQVFTAPRPSSTSQPTFLVGVATGAAVALAGVLVGAVITRRRRG